MASSLSVAKTPAKGKCLTLRDATCLVVEQGLTPDMARRACNNPGISNAALCREISKAIDDRAKKVVARNGEGSERGPGDAAKANEKETGTKKRCRAGAGAAVSRVAASERTAAFDARRFSAPYLGGRPTHFQRKVQKRVKQLMEKRPPNPSTSTHPTLPLNAFSNSKNNPSPQPKHELEQFLQCTKERYSCAFKEATQLFADLKEGKIDRDKKLTQQQYLDALNSKWSLDGKDCGRDKSREKFVLTLPTVRRSVKAGNIGMGPPKKGHKPGSLQKINRAKQEKPLTPETSPTTADTTDPPRNAEQTNDSPEHQLEACVPSVPAVRRSVKAGHVGVDSLEKGPKLESLQNNKQSKEQPPISKKSPTKADITDSPTNVEQTHDGPQHQLGTVERYNCAFREATLLLSDLRQGKVENPLPQQHYIDELNLKWSLNGEGRDGSREKRILNKSTIYRAIRRGRVGVGPMKKGRKFQRSLDLIRPVAPATANVAGDGEPQAKTATDRDHMTGPASCKWI